MGLTEEQKKKYLKDNNFCPFCDSEDIESDLFMENDFDEKKQDLYYITRECNECKNKWKDVFKLIGVQDVEPDDFEDDED